MSDNHDDVLTDLLEKLCRCRRELQEVEDRLPLTTMERREFDFQVEALAERCMQLQNEIRKLDTTDAADNSGSLHRLSNALECSVNYLERLTGPER